MEFINTSIEGLFQVKPFYHKDVRGSFVKTFHANEFKSQGLEYNFRESFYSESVRGVIRGMHFQMPPYEHVKLVFSMQGTVLDVILDLRKESATYGRYEMFELSEQNKDMLYIPKGLAHGFCSLTDKATLFYFTSMEYNPVADKGVRYDTFGLQWPVDSPVISARDRSFPAFEDFDSPF